MNSVSSFEGQQLPSHTTEADSLPASSKRIKLECLTSPKIEHDHDIPSAPSPLTAPSDTDSKSAELKAYMSRRKPSSQLHPDSLFIRQFYDDLLARM